MTPWSHETLSTPPRLSASAGQAEQQPSLPSHFSPLELCAPLGGAVCRAHARLFFCASFWAKSLAGTKRMKGLKICNVWCHSDKHKVTLFANDVCKDSTPWGGCIESNEVRLTSLNSRAGVAAAAALPAMQRSDRAGMPMAMQAAT